jgi:hypothetical protein
MVRRKKKGPFLYIFTLCVHVYIFCSSDRVELGIQGPTAGKQRTPVYKNKIETCHLSREGCKFCKVSNLHSLRLHRTYVVRSRPFDQFSFDFFIAIRVVEFHGILIAISMMMKHFIFTKEKINHNL